MTKSVTFLLALATIVAASLAVAPAATATTSPEAAAEGREIFLRSKCNTCHTIEALGIAQLSAEVEGEEEDEELKPKDLSDVGSTRDADWIKGWLTKQVEIDGKTHRKRFGGKPPELDALATWLAGLKK